MKDLLLKDMCDVLVKTKFVSVLIRPHKKAIDWGNVVKDWKVTYVFLKGIKAVAKLQTSVTNQG